VVLRVLIILFLCATEPGNVQSPSTELNLHLPSTNMVLQPPGATLAGSALLSPSSISPSSTATPLSKVRWKLVIHYTKHTWFSLCFKDSWPKFFMLWSRLMWSKNWMTCVQRGSG